MRSLFTTLKVNDFPMITFLQFFRDNMKIIIDIVVGQTL